jgi:hypothetical protein
MRFEYFNTGSPVSWDSILTMRIDCVFQYVGAVALT